MRIVYGAEATAPIASLALTVKLNAPPAEGVPLKVPVVPRVSPVGSVPVVDHVYGGTPALAENVCVYVEPLTPSGSVGEGVAIATGATIVIVSGRVAVC